MLNRKFLIIVISTMILVGCAIPTSEIELIENNRKYNYCSTDDFAVVVAKVNERMTTCYTRLSTKPYDEVSKDIKPDDSVSYVFSTRRALTTYYGFRVLIEKGESGTCKTRVTTHTMNMFWDMHSQNMFGWLDGTYTDCP